jgi:hypothetical protein
VRVLVRTWRGRGICATPRGPRAASSSYTIVERAIFDHRISDFSGNTLVTPVPLQVALPPSAIDPSSEMRLSAHSSGSHEEADPPSQQARSLLAARPPCQIGSPGARALWTRRKGRVSSLRYVSEWVDANGTRLSESPSNNGVCGRNRRSACKATRTSPLCSGYVRTFSCRISPSRLPGPSATEMKSNLGYQERSDRQSANRKL